MTHRLLYIILSTIFFGLVSCDDPYEGTTFSESTEMPNGNFLKSRADDFSEWIAILEYTDMFNAINQASEEFTVFAPVNEAVRTFYKEKGINSCQELDKDYAIELVKYHIINKGISQQNFLLGGRLTTPTLSEDYLTVTFNELETGQTDESSVLIDGHAGVIEFANNTTNGLVYVLSGVLQPVTETLYDRLQSSEYSIFRAAVDLTGWNKRLSTVYDTTTNDYGSKTIIKRKFTVLAVTDNVFAANGINGLDALKQSLNADNNYTDTDNSLNKYIGYHLLSSDYYANDFFTFENDSAVLLWNTQAKNEIVMSSYNKGNNYFNFDKTDSTGIRLVNTDNYVTAKNGVVHQVDNWMPVYTPEATGFKWDLCDYQEFESVVNAWGAEKDFGDCYQTYLKNQNGKLFDIDLTYVKRDAFTYTNTSSNNNWSTVGYAVLGNLDSSHKDRDYFSVDPNKNNCNNHDVLIVNVGYMGKVTFTTPTVIKGRYKIFVHYAFDSKLKNFFIDSPAKCKFSIDDNSEEISLYSGATDYDKPANGLNTIFYNEIWADLEFEETGTHEFSIVVMDPRASTYNEYRLFFDYIRFEPVE